MALQTRVLVLSFTSRLTSHSPLCEQAKMQHNLADYHTILWSFVLVLCITGNYVGTGMYLFIIEP